MTMANYAAVSGFWKAVEDCLAEFHGLSRGDARETVYSYRDRLGSEANRLGADWVEDLVYHAEPWRVASDLAGADLKQSDYSDEYDRILSQNGLTEFRVRMYRPGENYPSFLKA